MTNVLNQNCFTPNLNPTFCKIEALIKNSLSALTIFILSKQQIEINLCDESKFAFLGGLLRVLLLDGLQPLFLELLHLRPQRGDERVGDVPGLEVVLVVFVDRHLDAFRTRLSEHVGKNLKIGGSAIFELKKESVIESWLELQRRNVQVGNIGPLMFQFQNLKG